MKTLALLLLLISCTTIPRATHYHRYPQTPPLTPQTLIIDFYSRSAPYGEFSNFALFPILVDGQWWPTSEHYYQAMKYEDPKLQEWVRKTADPMEAANRGRDPQYAKRADWESYRNVVMEKAVRAKFLQYPELQTLLLSTGKARIFEHTENDCYWGDCGTHKGENRLGLLLEKIRAELMPKGE